MYAIFATGGKQYKVEEGDVIRVEKLDVNEGEEITFDQVLVIGDKTMKIGDPTVSGASVKGTVMAQDKEKKVVVYRYKPKTGYHKKNGHRQPYTQIKIESIIA
ncbi:MAG: 50S ribosomal protein L21 [Eubacterium sp.]|nr:50S ribosomal protein L21 [Eubacterium sp.]